ncbi:MAG: ATPase domain-containing protein [Planctomycetaceae bacterium]
MTGNRQSTGIAALDDMLGGGLIPGTLTVVLGATGVGKTQLGLHYAHAGKSQEGEAGIVFDLTSRGDAQNHADYARRMFGWTLSTDWQTRHPERLRQPDDVWDKEKARSDVLHLFQRSGKRVTIRDLDPDEWREWKIELMKKLDSTIAYFYGNFVHGVRRCVIDGVEPAEVASDSFQIHVFDYIYHQVLRKEAGWLARDLFRVHFRQNEEEVKRHPYDSGQIGCLLLQTTHEVLLDDLLSRRIESGDILSNANTIILMGKVRDGLTMKRALHVAKHRGSRCDDAIVPFEIGEGGLRIVR